MSLQRGVLGVAALVTFAAVGYIGYEALTEANAKARIRAQIDAERQDAYASAECAASALSDQGLEDLVVHQYKPSGLKWRDQQAISRRLNLSSMPPPTGEDLSRFKRQDNALDWQPFQELFKRCQPRYGPPFDETWRAIFWNRLEETTAFLTAVSKVRAINDSILATHRQGYADANAKKAEAAARAKQLREEALFRALPK